MEKIKIYFVTDAHLGVPDKERSLIREKKLIRWLDEVKKDATEIYLLGDIFEFWFEYKTVVPRGYTRLLGKLSEITDSGIPIYYFTGNHDMWMNDYFEKELNIKLVREPIKKEYNGIKFYIAHGDGLGPGDYGYKALKKIFQNRTCQWLFTRLHPNFAIRMAYMFSGLSRMTHEEKEKTFLGEEKERLIQYVKKKTEDEHYDYFIMGHRHLPLDININGHSRYINVGDWIRNFTYAVFDGTNLELKKFEEK